MPCIWVLGPLGVWFGGVITSSCGHDVRVDMVVARNIHHGSNAQQAPLVPGGSKYPTFKVSGSTASIE